MEEKVELVERPEHPGLAGRVVQELLGD